MVVDGPLQTLAYGVTIFNTITSTAAKVSRPLQGREYVDTELILW